MFNLDNITKKDDNKDWPYRKLIIGPSGSGKSNYLLNSIQKDNNIIDKILIVFDDMISHVISDKKAQQVLKDLFIRCRKLNISLCFLTQSYFSVPKDVRLNCTHYIIFKLNNKRELQKIAINHSADIDYKDFVKIYRDCKKEPYNFLTIDTTQLVDKRFLKKF